MAFDVGSAVAKIKADLSNFKQGIAEARNEADGLGNTMSRVGSGVADFGKQAAVLAGVVGGGLALTAKIGLDSAAKFEQYQIAYTTLLKDQKKASEAIAQIQKDAAKTPFELAPLVMANQRLISAGISAQDARKDILNLGDAISATGGGNAELERLSTNLQQIKAVGKASALDIKQFAFAGINVYEMLAQSTGKTVAEVREMDVSYEVLSKAFEKAAGKGGMFHEAMLKQSTTLNGLMSTLKDVVSLGLKDILMDSGIFDAIRNGVASVIPFLENTAVPAIVRFFRVIAGGIDLLRGVMSGQDLMAEVREFISYFMGGEMPGEDHPAVKFFYMFSGALQALGNWIAENQGLVITFLKGLGIALGVLLVIGTITALVTALMNPLVLVALGIAALYTAWETNFLGLKDITTAVFNAIMEVINNFVIPTINAFKEFITQNWTTIQTITMAIWDMISGYFKLWWAIVSGIFKIALALLKGDWGAAWDAVVEMITNAWEAIKQIFNGVINFIKGWGGILLSQLIRPILDAWNKISELVNKIKDALDFTKRHSPSVVDIVQKGVRLVNRAFDDLPINMPNLTPATGMGASMIGGTGNGGLTNLTLQINMDGAIISDDFGAQRIAEKVGDSIVKKLQQNIRF